MILAVDTETTGTDSFHGCRPFLVTACDGVYDYTWEGSVHPYTREVFFEDGEIDLLQKYLDQATTLVFHNTQFDMRMLSSIGIKIDHLWRKVEDTLVAAHAINSAKETENKDKKKKPVGRSLGLKDLSIEYLGYFDDDEKRLELAVRAKVDAARKMGYRVAKEGDPHFPGIKKNGTSFWKMDYWLAPTEVKEYGSHDARRTLALWSPFKDSLIRDGLWEVYRKRMKLLRIAYDMQTYGKFFYTPLAEEKLNELDDQIKRCKTAIRNLSGLNYAFDSDKKEHLKDLLFNYLKITPEYFTKGRNPQPQVDKAAIEAYTKKYSDTKCLQYLARLRKLIKRRTDILSYIRWTDENSRLHSNLNVTGTRETRQSSSSPNDQNFERMMRAILTGPPPGSVWISTDMVNIELRIWAYSVNNKELIQKFEQGYSVHEMIMEIIYPEEFKLIKLVKKIPEKDLTKDQLHIVNCYGYVKNGNFALIYGGSKNKVNMTYYGGKKNPPDYISKIDKQFPGIQDFTKSRIEMCEENLKRFGTYSVITLGGYRLEVPTDEPFKACNFYIQGGAGLIMTDCMIDWSEHPTYFKHDCHMFSQVHDSLDTEVKITEHLRKIIKDKLECMSNAGKKYIPTCDISYKLVVHSSDKENPIIKDLLENPVK